MHTSALSSQRQQGTPHLKAPPNVLLIGPAGKAHIKRVGYPSVQQLATQYRLEGAASQQQPSTTAAAAAAATNKSRLF
jgi:hypothetical protein